MMLLNRFAAVLLLAGALAACSEVPTAGSLVAVPSMNYPVPATTSVSNSGGWPLVSWSAVSGANSYTVNLITFYAVNGQYQGHSPAYLVNTTSTSYLDTDHPWTGTYECVHEPDQAGDTLTVWYEYEIVTNFSNGTSSIRHFASIAGPDQCW